MSTISAPDSLKMIRETLCVTQARIGYAADPRNREHIDRLQRLIDSIDQQRPLGPDGKHGDLHTPNCQCEDGAAGDATGRSEVDKLIPPDVLLALKRREVAALEQEIREGGGRRG